MVIMKTSSNMGTFSYTNVVEFQFQTCPRCYVCFVDQEASWRSGPEVL